MIQKHIVFFDKQVTLACDGQCRKAWGINHRPREQLSSDPDDYAFLTDAETGEAPACPGTWEGGHGKPCATVCTDPAMLNKWCARECERSEMVDGHRNVAPHELRDFSKRKSNIPGRLP